MLYNYFAMTDEALKNVIETALAKGSLWSSVNQSKSQFLHMGYLFTHLVLTDASKYESAVKVMQDLKRELQLSEKELRFLVRSTWEITDAEYLGPYYDKNLNLTAASAIVVRLKSGNRIHSIRVAVTEFASRALQMHTGTAEGDYAGHQRDMTEAAKNFITLLLAGGGTSNAWDP